MSHENGSTNKPANMEEIMSAIQKVLADHDVGQARVVLELFDEADQQQGTGAKTAAPTKAAPAVSQRKVTCATSSQTPTTCTKVEAMLLPIDLHPDGPPLSPQQQPPPPRPQSSSEHCTHMTSSAGTRLSAHPPSSSLPPPQAPPSTAAGAVDDEVEAKALAETARPPAASPSKMQQPAPTPVPPNALSELQPSTLLPEDLFRQLQQQQNRAERIAVLNSFVGKSALLDDKKQREALKQQSPPSNVHTFLSQYRSTHRTSGATSPAASSPHQRPSSRSSAVRLSIPAVDAAAAPACLAERKAPHVPGKNPIIGILNKDSSIADSGAPGVGGSLSGSTRKWDSVSVREEPAAPKSPVHKPVLGGAAMQRQPDGILHSGSAGKRKDGPNSPVQPWGLPTLSAPAAGKGLSSPVGTETLSTQSAKPPAPLPQQTPSQTSTSPLPVLDRQAFTASSRDNAARASQINVGLSSSYIPDAVRPAQQQQPTRGVPGATRASTGTSASPSLKEMLAEQQRMEKENQAALRQHAATMHKARDAIRKTEQSEKKVKPHLELLRAETAVDGPSLLRNSPVDVAGGGGGGRPVGKLLTPKESRLSPTGAAPKPPARATTEVSPRTRPLSHATTTATQQSSLREGDVELAEAATTPPQADTSLACSSQTTPRRSTNSSIHVVRFTMPSEKTAKDSVVAQLSRCPAGQQHLDSKDRYAAMLADQNEIARESEKKAKTYDQLVKRAVEFNESLRGGGSASKK